MLLHGTDYKNIMSLLTENSKHRERLPVCICFEGRNFYAI